MKKCLIIGKPNVGKTLFMLNFTEYLGNKNVSMQFTKSDKSESNVQYNIEYAKGLLSSNVPYETKSLQSIPLEVPVFMGKKHICMVDSSGLTDGIHRDLAVRRAMAQTLEAIGDSDIIFHMIDASDFNHGIRAVDSQLVRFGLIKEGYIILANKIDLLDSKFPIVALQKKFPKLYVIPISALTKNGFSEVKTYIRHRL